MTSAHKEYNEPYFELTILYMVTPGVEPVQPNRVVCGVMEIACVFSLGAPFSSLSASLPGHSCKKLSF